jgi:hypothetical protein
MRDVATGEMRSPQSRLCMKPLTYSIQGAVSVGVDFLAQTAMGLPATQTDAAVLDEAFLIFRRRCRQ